MTTHADHLLDAGITIVQRPRAERRRFSCTLRLCDLLDDQGVVLDRLIRHAFDTLGAHIFNVRVLPAEYFKPSMEHWNTTVGGLQRSRRLPLPTRSRERKPIMALYRATRRNPS